MAKKPPGIGQRWRAGQVRVRQAIAQLKRLEGPGSQRRLSRVQSRFRRAGPRKRLGAVQLVLLSTATFTAVVLAGLLGPELLRSPQVASLTTGVQRLADTPYYPSCGAAHAAGVYSIREDQPGYRERLDRDGDGVACEPYYER